ncbi:hypothetical protein QU38_02500, partial [Staphylococcus aureus]
AHILGRIVHIGDVAQLDRRIVAPGDDQVAIFLRGAELVVAVDRPGTGGTVEAALGRIGVGGGDRGAQRLGREPVGRQRLHIGLDAHRGPLAARERDQTDSAHLGDLGGEALVGQVLDLGEGAGAGSETQRHDRRVGGIDLGIDGRGRQVRREQRASRIDRRLHFLFRHVERQVELELERDDRGAGRG